MLQEVEVKEGQTNSQHSLVIEGLAGSLKEWTNA